MDERRLEIRVGLVLLLCVAAVGGLLWMMGSFGSLSRSDRNPTSVRNRCVPRRSAVHCASTIVSAGNIDDPNARPGMSAQEIIDRLILADASEVRWADTRIDTPHSHGTGCTLASAIATGLGRGLTLADSVARARVFVRLSLREAPGLGGGHGPMGHQAVRLDCDLGGAMLNQITLPLADYEASAGFYRLLGLRQIVESAPRYARFESASGATLSIEAADEVAGKPVIFFECGDLDAMVARLALAGVAVSDLVLQDWGWREARLTDPAGNAICLYQAGENRRFPPWRLA